MDYTENLFSRWARKDGLTPLHILGDFDGIGESLRLWWFYNGFERISPKGGLCDEEVIAFFSGTHEFTCADRMLIDQGHHENAENMNDSIPSSKSCFDK